MIVITPKITVRCLSYPLLFGFVSASYAAVTPTVVGQTLSASSSPSVWSSLFALILVLSLFFGCIWLLRKINGGNVGMNNTKLKIIGGIALGMREKVVLLQVGSKQLVLAVTPGRIETLTVLEGEDCLTNPHAKPVIEMEGSFAQKLMQALKNRSDV